MGKTYTVQILNDKEFDNLPYKGISDSLGIADKEKGLAFVRSTGLKGIDETTLHHEIDELISKHSNHEDEFGIRHKKGGFARQIVPAILAIAGQMIGIPAYITYPAVTASKIGMDEYARSQHPEQLGEPGKIGGILGSTIQGLASAVAGTNLAAGGLAGGTAAAPGFASKAGGIISGSLLGTAPTATVAGSPGLVGAGGKLLGIGAGSLAPTGVASGLSTGSGALSGLGSLSNTFKAGQVASLGTPVSLGGATSSLVGGASGLSAAPAAANSLLGSSISNVGSNLQAPVVQQQAPVVNAVETAPKASFLKTLGERTKDYLTKPETLLGGALTIGSTMGKQPEYPEIDIESIRNSLLAGQAQSPLAQQARTQLSQIMNAKSGELYPTATDAYYQSAFRQIEKSYSNAQESLAQRYNLIDPNYLQNGEYQLLAQKLDEELANVKSDYAITEEQRRFELQRSQQYQSVKDALAVDDASMQELLGFTNLSIVQAAQKYNVEEKDVEELRKAMGSFGGQLLTSGSKTILK